VDGELEDLIKKAIEAFKGNFSWYIWILWMLNYA
jgi:hypothetical protein